MGGLKNLKDILLVIFPSDPFNDKEINGTYNLCNSIIHRTSYFDPSSFIYKFAKVTHNADPIRSLNALNDGRLGAEMYASNLEDFSVIKLFESKTGVRFGSLPHLKEIFAYHYPYSFSSGVSSEVKAITEDICDKIHCLALCHAFLFIYMVVESDLKVQLEDYSIFSDLTQRTSKINGRKTYDQLASLSKIESIIQNVTEQASHSDSYVGSMMNLVWFFHNNMCILKSYINSLTEDQIIELIQTKKDYILMRGRLTVNSKSYSQTKVINNFRKEFVSHFHFCHTFLIDNIENHSLVDMLVVPLGPKVIENVLIEI